MNSSFDFDDQLLAWLDDQAVSGAPDDLLGRVSERASQTRRRPAWATLERWISMETRAQLGAVPRTAIIVAILAVLLAVLSAIAVGQQPSLKLPPPMGTAANGLIAFDDGGDIYVVNPDATGRHALTSGPADDTAPAWSEDGTRIAYWSQQRPNGTLALMVMDADGTDVRTLVEGVTLSPVELRASWSHDGRYLAYSDSAGEPGREVNRIMVIDVAGGDPVEIASPGEAPTWSPDDQVIGYRSGGRTKDLATEPIGLSVIGADGTGQRIIDGTDTPNPWAYTFPQWSPDGQRLTYHTRPSNDVNDIYVAAVDGSEITGVGPEPRDGVWPVWSPDGYRIAYEGPSTVDGMYQIGVMDPDGSNAMTPEHPPLGCNCWVKWSPDGTKLIAYQAAPVADAPSINGSLMIADLSGSVPIKTIPFEGVTSQEASWQRLAP